MIERRRTIDADLRLRVLTLALDVGSGQGGAEKLAYEVPLRLDRARFKSYVCSIRRPFPRVRPHWARDRAQLEHSGVQVLALNQPTPFLLTPLAWWRLYRLLASERIDVLHAHMPRASVPGALLARLARVTVVISHEHGSAVAGRVLRPLLDRMIVARLSTMIICVSEWDRRQLIELEGIPAQRITVLPNGISPPPVEGKDVRADLGITPGLPLIGAVGRLYEEKGHDDLIRAVALLKQRSRPVRCVIVGVGPHEPSVRRLIDELHVGDEVRLLGRRSDVPDLIRAFDVAVLCSRREGSPLAMLEYMAAAAPIVATAVGGVPELIDDGGEGLLVPGRDPVALAAGIERLLEDRQLAQRLGRGARDRQRSQYALDVVVGRLERLYVELRRGRAHE